MQKMASGEKVPTHQSMLLSYHTYCAYITIFYFLFYIIIYTIFTVQDIFYNILSMNDARDTTNFTTYVLQIGMSPIKKTISNIYSLYF